MKASGMQTILGANGQIAIELARDLRAGRAQGQGSREDGVHGARRDGEGRYSVVIGRAPEFYGPGRTQSFTKALIIDKLKAGDTPRVPVRDDTRRTLIWTPDASRALAILGNTPDAFGQTWHLPCCVDRPTYKELVAMACEVLGRETSYRVIGKWTLSAAGLFSRKVREIRELLPRYEHDNLFDSTKFKRRFPGFEVTSYRHGLELIRRDIVNS